MENNNEEVAEMRHKYSELLKDISFICNRVNKKSERLLSEIEKSSDELDINSLEKVGLQIAKMLEVLKGNSIVYINYLLKELDVLNENRPEKLFCDMSSKLLECRFGTVIVDGDNNNFAQFAEKGTLTDDIESNSATTTAFFTNTLASTSENNLFRLRREATTDTIQTEDSWEDTLQRTKGEHSVKIEESIEFPEMDTNEDNFNDTTMIVDNQAEKGTFEENYTKKKKDIVNKNDLVKDDSGHSDSDLQKEGLKDGEKDEDKSPTMENLQQLFISSSDDELYSAVTQVISKKRRVIAISTSSESEQILSEDKSENETQLENSDDDNKSENKCTRKNTTAKQTEDSLSTEEKCFNSPDLDVDRTKEERNSSTNNESNISHIQENSNSPDLFTLETDVTDIEEKKHGSSSIDKEVENCIESTINDSKSLKDKNVLDEYANPYSIETEKISSEEEPESELISRQRNSEILNDHSYSASASDLEDGSPKSTDPKKLLESANIESTDNESNTNVEDISKRTNELEKLEIDSDSPILNNRLEANDEKGKDECVLNEHNYSSSSSHCFDTDETDIEKEIHRTEHDSNKLILENSEHKAESEERVNSNTCSSNQSYEFDISNYPKLEKAGNSKDLKDIDSFAEELEKLIVQEQMDQHGTDYKENDERVDDNVNEDEESKEHGDIQSVR